MRWLHVRCLVLSFTNNNDSHLNMSSGRWELFAAGRVEIWRTRQSGGRGVVDARSARRTAARHRDRQRQAGRPSCLMLANRQREGASRRAVAVARPATRPMPGGRSAAGWAGAVPARWPRSSAPAPTHRRACGQRRTAARASPTTRPPATRPRGRTASAAGQQAGCRCDLREREMVFSSTMRVVMLMIVHSSPSGRSGG